MKPPDALEAFESLLARAGVAVERRGGDLLGDTDDHHTLLRVFCEFARIPADEPFETRAGTLRLGDDADDDLLLHESGVRRDGIYQVSLTRQFAFEDGDGEYAGMNGLSVELDAVAVPPDRVPTAQRWGYAGPKRPDVSDEGHTEMANWAGHVDTWEQAVAASNSWKAFDVVPLRGFRALQSDY